MSRPPGPTASIPGRDPREEQVRRFRLSVVEGPGKGAESESESDRCSIGSHPSNDLVIEDSTVSRFHCEVRVTRTGARVRDLDSKNGTVLDGVRIYEAAPRGGSLLRLGQSVVRFDFQKAHNRLPVHEDCEFGPLVAESVSMRTVFTLLERAAGTNATVLIEGETGTGKELAARAIHDTSSRKDAPFVIVDCGAIPENLLESEFFGHEKGAFTGADTRRIGAFEEADGGTIFLDEIGELPLDLQPKLLRVLEGKQIRRVGSNAHHKVDTRIVAATNRDLRAEVNEGRFREDLFYRLSVIKITLPPLRERPEDVPILAQSILDSLDADDETTAKYTHPEFLARLSRAAWSGNVRELRNYLERCVVLSDEPPVAGAWAAARRPEVAVDPSIPYADARRETIAAFEKNYSEALLDAHDGNVSRAAEAAGIGRVYLYKLLKRHKIR